MGKIILYHGTPDKIVVPKFGGGDDKHDYGRGFYLTENIELAKEWAVCRPNDTNGWVHKYELETAGLKILDFQQHSVLAWLAELMKHRTPPTLSDTVYWQRNLSKNTAWIPAIMM